MGLNIETQETRRKVFYMKHRTCEYSWKQTNDRTEVETGPKQTHMINKT